jgi:ssRNA-specific RNase YbeY (16S rRNA maturation enzyme)
MSLAEAGLTVYGCAQGIWIATDQEIRELNKMHRGKDRATDVLSFPMTRVSPSPRPRPCVAPTPLCSLRSSRFKRQPA